MMRKTLFCLLVLIMILCVTSTAYAAISGVTVDPANKTVTEGADTATFTVTVSNDNTGHARGTTFSIEGNEAITGLSNFEPDEIDLSRNSTAQTTLTIQTSELGPNTTHTFKIKAEAPDIEGRGNSGQSASWETSEEVTLIVEASGEPGEPEEPEKPEEPEPVDPVEDDPVGATAVEEGSSLSESQLSGSFKDPGDGTTVEGTLEWTNGEQTVNETGYFEWTFTPDNTEAYNVITGTVEVVVTSVPSEPTSIHYVALGDSLATGSTSRGTTTSYVHGFRSFLEGKYGVEVTMENLAADGDDSTDLLDKLADELFADKVREADIITLSIGGNNIMHAGRNSFSDIDEDAAEEGTKRFEDEYAQIISKIRELNPHAQIISMTLYNPYNTKPIRGYEDDPELHKITAGYIDRINNQIWEITNSENDNYDDNYFVADVHSRFLVYANGGKMGDITYFYPFRWFKSTRDPHPNQAGQDLMREIHEDVFNKSISLNQSTFLMAA